MTKHKHRWVHKRSTNGMRAYTRMVERECDICGVRSWKTLPIPVATLNKFYGSSDKHCVKESYSSIRRLQDKIGNLLNEYINAIYRIEGKNYKADLTIVPVENRTAAKAFIGSKNYTGSRLQASLEEDEETCTIKLVPGNNRITRKYEKIPK